MQAACNTSSKILEVPFPGGLTGAEVAEKMLRDNKIHNVEDHPRQRTTDRPLQSADDDRQFERRGLFEPQRRGGSHRLPRMRPRHPACTRATLRWHCVRSWVPIVQFSSRMAMFVIIIGLVILASTQNELLCWIGVGMIGVSALFSIITLPVGIQRFAAGPRLAPEQPHARRRTARTSQGSPLVGCPHLPGSGARGAVASLLYYVLMILGRRD